MKLFLDDIRVPTGVEKAWHNGGWENFPSHYTWDIVRSYKAFTEIISNQGLPTLIAFDHDLCYEDQNKNDYATFKEKTGYHCAQWLVEYCLEHDIPEVPDFYVHTLNPVGRINIISLLTSYNQLRIRYKDAGTDSEGPKSIIPRPLGWSMEM